MVSADFWKNRKVFLTGHTGFKGAWLSIWLHMLGAKVTAYALGPPSVPSLFELAEVDRITDSTIGDIRDLTKLQELLRDSRPEIVIHMAAQSLVRESYSHPIETLATNVMGTANLLEAIRSCDTVKAVVIVTSDKCYENREWVWGYRESDILGGRDIYSSSKACSELITNSFRDSFFQPDNCDKNNVAISTVRAGNVIGGGDWGKDRLVPDCIRAFISGKSILIRNPDSIRPWQHVLEPLSGYLLISQRLYEDGCRFAGAWNFGPDENDARSVEWVVRSLCSKWGQGASYAVDCSSNPHESQILKLDCLKAKSILNWHPRWPLEKTLDRIIEWTRAYTENKNLLAVCSSQIEDYSNCKFNQ